MAFSGVATGFRMKIFDLVCALQARKIEINSASQHSLWKLDSRMFLLLLIRHLYWNGKKPTACDVAHDFLANIPNPILDALLVLHALVQLAAVLIQTHFRLTSCSSIYCPSANADCSLKLPMYSEPSLHVLTNESLIWTRKGQSFKLWPFLVLWAR